jgi:hypothetical protein
MNFNICTLVTTIVDLIMLSSLMLSFLSFANCVVECAFIFFLCHHMLPHYFKLEPSWLNHEVTWMAYLALIFHIHTLTATIVIVVQYCIIISFF